jgi:hypothetical protein
MNKKFLCLTSIDGYRIRMRADTVVEYGDLYGEDQMTDGTKLIIGEKTVVGSYINGMHQDDASTHVTETVGQIDYMLSSLDCGFVDAHVIDDDFREMEHRPMDAEDCECLICRRADGSAKHWSEQSLNEHDSLFERVWGRYKRSQPADPAKWVVPERGGKELGDCACCDKSVECGRATPDDPDEVKND